MDDCTERLNELEMRYTHQSRQLEELNEELTAACTRLDNLTREVKAMREMLGRLSPTPETSPDE